MPPIAQAPSTHNDTASWVDTIGNFITVVTGLLGVALAWFKHYLPARRRRKEANSFLAGLEEVGKVYEIMDDMIDTAAAKRCIVFAAHDSGGLPRAGAPFYTTALNWRCTHSSKVDIGEYKNLTVDGHYVNMLITLMQQGELHFRTSDHPNTYLGDIYRTENVSEAILFFLGIRENKFLYLSVAVFADAAFTPEQRTVLRIRASHLRQLLSKEKP